LVNIRMKSVLLLLLFAPVCLAGQSIVIDTHEDTPQQFLDDDYDIGSADPSEPVFISLDKARDGSLGAIFFSIWANPAAFQGRYAQRTLQLIDSVYIQAARHRDRMAMCFSALDIERAHREQKLAALMGIEGGHSIENSLALLRNYYRLGVRYMTLTHVNTNDWADSSGDIHDKGVRHHDGLTAFGKQVVAEMNRLGMMVDLSHVSDKTFWDVIAATKVPVIASHSSARALVDDPRNMSDEMLRAISHNGGVVNVAFPGSFVDARFNERQDAQHQRMLAAAAAYNHNRRANALPITEDGTQHFELEWLSKNPIPRAPFDALIDEIDYLAKVAGVDHVGLGSDSNGIAFLPAGINSAADLPKIAQALRSRGYSQADINKMMGENMLRVMREVETISKTLERD
jgi:membrane dipeptidase